MSTRVFDLDNPIEPVKTIIDGYATKRISYLRGDNYIDTCAINAYEILSLIFGVDISTGDTIKHGSSNVLLCTNSYDHYLLLFHAYLKHFDSYNNDHYKKLIKTKICVLEDNESLRVRLSSIQSKIYKLLSSRIDIVFKPDIIVFDALSSGDNCESSVEYFKKLAISNEIAISVTNIVEAENASLYDNSRYISGDIKYKSCQDNKHYYKCNYKKLYNLSDPLNNKDISYNLVSVSIDYSNDTYKSEKMNILYP